MCVADELMAPSKWCGTTTVSLSDRIKERIDSKWTERYDLFYLIIV